MPIEEAGLAERQNRDLLGKMIKRRPVAVDLFAGAGGMSLGFEQAGFDVVAAVELDPVHAATHHFNFPLTRTLARSVIGLDALTILDACGVGAGREEIDVVFGGPPCQGFSLIGQRMLEDPRNQLVGEFLRLVVDLKARYFVFENVKGLNIGKHRKFLENLVDEFREHGYDVVEPWRVLNAKHYGVPQDRQRLFLIGARQGLPLPEYPEPVNGDEPDLFSSEALQPLLSCAEALGDLPDNECFEELARGDCVLVEARTPASEYGRTMRCEGRDCWHFGYRRIWERNLLTSSMRTAHTKISRRRFGETPEGGVEPISRFFKLPRNGQCNTLRAGTDCARGAFTSPRPIHYRYNRCITVREMARLHGYPDWFRFHITKWHGARQVGNSVPPPLARAVASSIMQAAATKPRASRKQLALGNTELLALNITEAAAYWGVDVPIGRRDRKSGARKRKQHEVEAGRMAEAGR